MIVIGHVMNTKDIFSLSLILCKAVNLHDAKDLHPILGKGKCRYEHS